MRQEQKCSSKEQWSFTLKSLNKVVSWTVSSCLVSPETPCRDENRHLLEQHFKKHRFNASEHFGGGTKQPKCGDQNARGGCVYDGGEEH